MWRINRASWAERSTSQMLPPLARVRFPLGAPTFESLDSWNPRTVTRKHNRAREHVDSCRSSGRRSAIFFREERDLETRVSRMIAAAHADLTIVIDHASPTSSRFWHRRTSYFSVLGSRRASRCDIRTHKFTRKVAGSTRAINFGASLPRGATPLHVHMWPHETRAHSRARLYPSLACLSLTSRNGTTARHVASRRATTLYPGIA